MLSGARYIFARDRATLEKGIAQLADFPVVVVDTETQGLDPLEDRVLLIQVGTDTFQLLVDCVRVDPAPLADLLRGPQVKVFQNGKFDLKMLDHWFKMRAKNVADTMLIEQIIDNFWHHGKERVERISLGMLARKYLKREISKEERESFTRSTGDFTAAQIEYARTDVAATYLVFLRQMELLKKEGLTETARIECATLPVYARMELAGMHLARERWLKAVQGADQAYQEKRKALMDYFRGTVRGDLFGDPDADFDSDQQLRPILEKAGLATKDLRKDTLLATGHPAARLVVEYREARSVRNTQGTDFLKFVHPADGRVHADWAQISANSGRSSCAEPNLQAIPKAVAFRSCFSAPEGRRIVTADYSGCELRIIAEASEDPIFIRTFKRGGDLHSIVAQAVFGKKVTKDENADLRAQAKIINFGLAYGMGPVSLAAQLKRPVPEAERFLAQYFKTFPTIYNFLEVSSSEALDRGWCATLGGRKCRLPDRKSLTPAAEQEALRFARNLPIQGTNADIVKVAMAGIDRTFEDRGIDAAIVHMVHDEIVAEVPSDRAVEAAAIVKEEMVAAGARYVRSVPMEVECHIGDYWGHKGETA